VLGNLFDAEGFDYITSEDVRNEISWAEELAIVESSRPEAPAPKGSRADGFDLARIADVPLYRVDALVRRAASLQNTGDNPPAMAHLGNEEAQRLGVAEGEQVDVAGSVASVSLPVHINAAVPPGSIYVPSGWEATEPLGASPFVKVSKV
jgi:NADH-quinone oxidoreductase subunit G